MGKDWTGDSNSIFKTLGSSHHTDEDREENDFYATDPRAAYFLTTLEWLSPRIWEPACGAGHLAKVFEAQGYQVRATDLIDRGYGQGGVNFLATKETWAGDIVTNPPYKFATEFVRKAMETVEEGHKVCMFLKLQFLEGKSRRQLFDMYRPRRIWVSSSRINCAKNGDFTGQRISGGSAICYAWFIWEKGYHGETTIKWFN